MFGLGAKVQQPVEVVSLEEKIEELKAQLAGLQQEQSLSERIDELQTELVEQASLLKAAKASETDSLNRVAKLERDIKGLESTRKIADEDIQHMIKLNEGQQALEKREFEVEKEAEKAEAIAEAKDEYRDKLEVIQKEQIKAGEKLVEQVLARLPDASMKIKASV